MPTLSTRAEPVGVRLPSPSRTASRTSALGASSANHSARSTVRAMRSNPPGSGMPSANTGVVTYGVARPLSRYTSRSPSTSAPMPSASAGVSGRLHHASPVTGSTVTSRPVSNATGPFTTAPGRSITGAVRSSSSIDSVTTPRAATAPRMGAPSSRRNASRCRSGIRFAR